MKNFILAYTPATTEDNIMLNNIKCKTIDGNIIDLHSTKMTNYTIINSSGETWVLYITPNETTTIHLEEVRVVDGCRNYERYVGNYDKMIEILQNYSSNNI